MDWAVKFNLKEKAVNMNNLHLNIFSSWLNQTTYSGSNINQLNMNEYSTTLAQVSEHSFKKQKIVSMPSTIYVEIYTV